MQRTCPPKLMPLLVAEVGPLAGLGGVARRGRSPGWGWVGREPRGVTAERLREQFQA
jgi:hypothetical protein